MAKKQPVTCEAAKPITYNAIRRAIETVENRRKQFLTDHGWNYTCSGVASPFWLWEKQINGKTYLCDTYTAISITEYSISNSIV